MICTCMESYPQAPNKSNKLMFTKWTVAFFLSMVSEVPVWKNSEQTLP